jgi:hypothetical protein
MKFLMAVKQCTRLDEIKNVEIKKINTHAMNEQKKFGMILCKEWKKEDCQKKP